MSTISKTWFKSISLGKIRSFDSKQTISFTDKNGAPAQWNIILGDNGTGKTTVLKGLCFATGAFWSDTEAVILRRTYESISIKCILATGNEEKSISQTIEFNDMRYGTFVKYANYHAREEAGESFALFGYGAARGINQAVVSEQVSPVLSIFREDAPLSNAEQWLLEAELSYNKDSNQTGYYLLVRNALQKLFREEVQSIKTQQRRYAVNVYFQTAYGEVRLNDLSLGYRTLIAWMVDFARGLFDRYPDSTNPLAEPAVCLVDEIDLHLHPRFQRYIIEFLTETFPNTQFIVTAHSPLIVQAAEGANIILLKRVGNETVVENDKINVHDWRIDQILSSDLFGGIGGRAPQIEDKMTRRRELLKKDDLTAEEIHELDNLEEELSELPASESREALKALDLIIKATSNLQKK
ncbi:AAA family ATPase [Spirosoma oryzicola]|uniref:AAA family ATPase n=1 Tax=Spirosoma oryzicola TaxID=2898794 RepID=UPI001E3809E6|nr:AAA family ATPase [Spirosoma oryzicola]UHG90133.1 AAA family ATPase [Spirosoma oryzicola]